MTRPGPTIFLLALTALVGCERAPAVPNAVSDAATAEALVRAEMGVPAAATVGSVSATAAPAAASVLPAALTKLIAGPPSTAALRVVATFDLPLSAVDPTYWSDWKPMPLPAAVSSFHEPPLELIGQSGYYRCSLRAWSPASTDGWAADSCAAPPANFDGYQAEVYDPQTGKLSVVIKRYY